MSLISYEEALNIIQMHGGLGQTQTISITQALGFVCAEAVFAHFPIPGFRNSAMDGFAVKSHVIKDATPTRPITLVIEQVRAAGDEVNGAFSKEFGDCSSVQIMTGAVVPEEFDAVVPVEQVVINDNEVIFKNPVAMNENIRLVGEDVQAGQCILARGSSIGPEHIMLLAACGKSQVMVFKKPKVGVICTGNEISDEYDQSLEDGHIYNANAPYLMAAMAKENLSSEYLGLIRDDPVLFQEKLANVPAGSVVVSTGAVSKGNWDFIPETLEKMGAKIHFHRVNIRPGKPILFATLAGGGFYFGLPGNPVSTVIGFAFFVLPLIQGLQAKRPAKQKRAKLMHAFRKRGDFRQFLKAKLSTDENGQCMVEIASGQESFKINSLVVSNAWVVLDGDQREWTDGEMVDVVEF